MKVILTVLMTWVVLPIKAQLTVATTISVKNQAYFSYDGLTIRPDVDMVVSNLLIEKTDKPIVGSPTHSINRVYTITPSISIPSSQIGIIFKPEELNGNTESMLQIAYRESPGSPFVTTSNSIVDQQQHNVRTAMSNSAYHTITATNGNSTLPVTLVAFDAEKFEGKIKLVWSTAYESNSSFFEVQHSQDGRNWHIVDTVQSHGESNSRKEYSYIHEFPFTGTNLYRLRMVDLDGSFTLSKIRFVEIQASDLVNVYPNPAHDYVMVDSPAQQQIRNVEITGLQGSTMQKMKPISLNRYDMSGWPIGTYLIKTTTVNGHVATHKVIKE